MARRPSFSIRDNAASTLGWVQSQTAPMGVIVPDNGWNNEGWKNGKIFCAILANYFPDKINFKSLTFDSAHAVSNLQLAFKVRDEVGIYACIEELDGLEVWDKKVYVAELQFWYEKLSTLTPVRDYQSSSTLPLPTPNSSIKPTTPTPTTPTGTTPASPTPSSPLSPLSPGAAAVLSPVASPTSPSPTPTPDKSQEGEKGSSSSSSLPPRKLSLSGDNTKNATETSTAIRPATPTAPEKTVPKPATPTPSYTTNSTPASTTTTSRKPSTAPCPGYEPVNAQLFKTCKHCGQLPAQHPDAPASSSSSSFSSSSFSSSSSSSSLSSSSSSSSSSPSPASTTQQAPPSSPSSPSSTPSISPNDDAEQRRMEKVKQLQDQLRLEKEEKKRKEEEKEKELARLRKEQEESNMKVAKSTEEEEPKRETFGVKLKSTGGGGGEGHSGSKPVLDRGMPVRPEPVEPVDNTPIGSVAQQRAMWDQKVKEEERAKYESSRSSASSPQPGSESFHDGPTAKGPRECCTVCIIC